MAEFTRRALLGLIGATALTAGGIDVAGAAERPDRVRLRGVVRYAANGTLPAGRLTIRLEEQGVMDKAADLIAATSVRSSGRRRLVPFEMDVPKAALRRAVDPGFTVRLERGGRLIALNTSKQRYRGRGDVSLTIEPILY
ncbi:MAG: hypothetical protein ABS57_08845 [Mesorhizobium sp. SCN 65-12]|nr:MAG: hypothetical protein ABS57_08845 [Mesorhizobium sp. SCN 65-12]